MKPKTRGVHVESRENPRPTNEEIPTPPGNRTGAPRQGEEPVVPDGAGAFVEGCEAFLAGRYAEWRQGRHQAVPGWAWFNALAHGSLPDVIHLAETVNSVSGADEFVAQLAAQILDMIGGSEGALRDLQHCRLQPLETALRVRFGEASPQNRLQLVEWMVLAIHPIVRRPTS
jgi:hypothetical protein